MTVKMAGARHLIFDLDGTLVDSAPDLATALNGLLAEFGKPALAETTVRSMVGDGAGVLVQRGLQASGLGDADQPAALKRFLALYRDCLIEKTRAYPEVEATLEQLQAAGHKLGVCTNKPYDPTQRILNALKLDRFFGTVIGGDSLPKRKPDPEPLLAAIEGLGGPAATACQATPQLIQGFSQMAVQSQLYPESAKIWIANAVPGMPAVPVRIYTQNALGEMVFDLIGVQ